MTKNKILPVLAAGLLLVGIVAMLFLLPTLSGREPNPAVPVTHYTDPTTEPTTEAPTPPPTEPPTEPPTYPPAETMAPSELSLTAKYAFAYDCATERYLYEGGKIQEKLSPASLTKLMTAYVVLQHMDAQQVVTVGEEVTWIDPMSSIAFLQPGHKLTVEMLVQGLIMQSGNDAAYTLAVACGRTIAEDPQLDRKAAYDLFVQEMNAQALLLELENTHYMNPDGIDQEGHYTTVEDLVKLSLAVMDDPIIMKYAGMEKADVTFASGHTCTWTNSNYLLRQDKSFLTNDAIGLKTGSTSGAGKCLLSLFVRSDGTKLLIGVLGSATDDGRYTDTLILYNRYR